jgi:plasmid rolling circle replication initiator protein Rep
MHAASTAKQGDSRPGPIEGPLDGFTKHRRYNRPIAVTLFEDPELRGIASAIANCSQMLRLELPLELEQLRDPRLRAAYLCNRRLCPFCEWRRTRVRRAAVLGGLEAFHKEHPNWRAVFLTLTVRNCQVSDLGETLRHMHQSFARLKDTRVWPTDYWLRRTEITVNRGTSPIGALEHDSPTESLLTSGGGSGLTVHPHIHCLLMVRPSYFSRDYVKQLRWQQEWQMAARLDYPPVIDVRTAKAKGDVASPGNAGVRDAVIEAAKYVSKATDLVALGPALREFALEVHRVRLFAVSKKLRQYVTDAEITAKELLDPSLAETAPQTPFATAIAQWCDQAAEYRFID